MLASIHFCTLWKVAHQVSEATILWLHQESFCFKSTSKNWIPFLILSDPCWNQCDASGIKYDFLQHLDWIHAKNPYFPSAKQKQCVFDLKLLTLTDSGFKWITRDMKAIYVPRKQLKAFNYITWTPFGHSWNPQSLDFPASLTDTTAQETGELSNVLAKHEPASKRFSQ